MASRVLAEGAPGAATAAAPADSEEWGTQVIRNWQQVKAAALGPQHKVESLREVRESALYSADTFCIVQNEISAISFSHADVA